MDVILHLDGYCVETAAKKKYDEIVRKLLKEDDEELERQLELLIEFLKKADFGKLRSMGFDGSKRISVRVRKVDDEFLVEEA